MRYNSTNLHHPIMLSWLESYHPLQWLQSAPYIIVCDIVIDFLTASALLSVNRIELLTTEYYTCIVLYVWNQKQRRITRTLTDLVFSNHIQQFHHSVPFLLLLLLRETWVKFSKFLLINDRYTWTNELSMKSILLQFWMQPTKICVEYFSTST